MSTTNDDDKESSDGSLSSDFMDAKEEESSDDYSPPPVPQTIDNFKTEVITPPDQIFTVTNESHPHTNTPILSQTEAEDNLILEVDPLDTDFGQNRLWNDICPYDSFPTMRQTLYTVGTGEMNVRKDCHRCNRSFLLEGNSCKWIEAPYTMFL
jgi:hypothetical protein